MTAPAIAPLVEALEHRACCTAKIHTGHRPPAAFWIDQHGCIEQLVCHDCYTWLRDCWDEWISTVDRLNCPRCHQKFKVFGDAFRVEPL